jgi:hypothetical protein
MAQVAQHLPNKYKVLSSKLKHTHTHIHTHPRVAAPHFCLHSPLRNGEEDAPLQVGSHGSGANGLPVKRLQ